MLTESSPLWRPGAATWRPGSAMLSVAPGAGGGGHAWAAPASVTACAKQMPNVFSLSPSFLKAKILYGFL